MVLNKKECLKITFTLVVYLILLGLFIEFFFIDQISDYLKGRFTVSSRNEEADTLEFPTITLCMYPATKTSVGIKYGFEKFNDKFNKEVPSSTLAERLDELSYTLHQDFQLINAGREFKVGLNIANSFIVDPGEQVDLFTFDLQPLKTYHYGTCYKLQPQFEVTKFPTRISFIVALNSTMLKPEDLPKSVILHFTSNETWIGLADNVWPQVKPLTKTINFRKEFTQIKLSVNEQRFQEGVEDNQACLKNLLLKQNCTKHCNVLSFAGEDFPTCQTVKELNCMWNNSILASTEYMDCYKSKLVTTFSLQQRIENPLNKGTDDYSTEIYIGMWSKIKQTQEEVPLMTEQDLIGSVGGSMGLFFGFSISASLFFWLKKGLDRLF